MKRQRMSCWSAVCRFGEGGAAWGRTSPPSLSTSTLPPASASTTVCVLLSPGKNTHYTGMTSTLPPALASTTVCVLLSPGKNTHHTAVTCTLPSALAYPYLQVRIHVIQVWHPHRLLLSPGKNTHHAGMTSTPPPASASMTVCMLLSPGKDTHHWYWFVWLTRTV